MSGDINPDATRRGVLMGGALGLGSVAGLAAAGTAAASPTVATVDAAGSGAAYFLRLEGIPGDSVDARHQGWIDIQSHSWGASNPVVFGGPGGGTVGRANLSSLHLTTALGSAAPQLFQRLVTGQHLQRATLEGVSLKEGLRFHEVRLEEVFVESYQTSGSPGDRPTDSISLAFGRITYTFWPVLPNGQLGEPVTASFDVSTNS